jgi:6-phosphogluconolactonase/glucosamine-6-phosphate isomerase/deaminase
VSDDIELVIVEDADEVAAAVAERLARAAREGGHIALTGGRTPEQAYEEAAKREPDWSNTEIWWSDERCVPPDDDLSNYALAKRTLLDQLEEASIDVDGLSVRTPDLDDVFLSLTSKTDSRKGAA